MSFVHLHNHTDYSFLDGVSKVTDLCLGAKELGMPAVAITDHGNLCGAVNFYREARRLELKPIIGCELYLTPGSRHHRGKDAYGHEVPIYHLLVLAKNRTGWQNLMTLSSAGYLEGFYKRPRVDYELLEAHHEGLICLSGCIQSHISQTIINNGEEEAYNLIKQYLDLFDDDFYFELQNHGIDEELLVNRSLVEFADKLNIKIVATNDTHYLKRSHAVPHDILLCIQTRSDYEDDKRYQFKGAEFYLKSYEEMLALFEEIPEALDNTLEVMEKIELEFNFSEKHFPRFTLPEGEVSDESYLLRLCQEGFPRRYSKITDYLQHRLETEIGVIVKKKLASYLLIVRDFISYARSKGIPVGPGRGSAAGSLVCYLIGITDIDPIKYDLLFERFINPERESYPDIDVDFSDTRRSEVIEYVRRKYGAECVSQIITFGRMLSKGVVRDVGRVLKVPLPEVDVIAKLIPEGPNVTLKKSLEDVKELAELVHSKPEYETLIEHALQLEGTIRNAGIHAAGVVVTPEPLGDLVPLYKASEGGVCTQFDMWNIESIGLLKVDLLGLKTLTIIEQALKLIKKRHGEIDLYSIPLNDPKTFELFSKGQTVGIFQFESSGMRENLIKLKPERFEDLIAMNALYRPGPMSNIEEFIERRHGRRKITYLHPKLASILDETYGIIVYQEQVIKIANILANMSLGRADVLRYAMGKKKKELMEMLRPEFIAGCSQNGIDQHTIQELWKLVDHFAEYGFNKSHAAGYALIAFQTAYLKAHYPAEFMAATMTIRAESTDELVRFLVNCKKMGVEVLPPDVNESEEYFTVNDTGAVRFGLAAIKNVGKPAIQAILGARDLQGKFLDLADLASRVDSPLVNHKVLESLIRAGATDSLEGHRGQKLHFLHQAISYAQQAKQERSRNQVSLFGEDNEGLNLPRPVLPNVPDLSTQEKLADEKELLGFYSSGHPLYDYLHEIKALSSCTIQELEQYEPDKQLQLVGIVTTVNRVSTRKGELMGRGRFEDLSATVRFIIFPKAYEENRELLIPGAPVLVKGKVQKRENDVELILESVEDLKIATARLTKRVTIKVDNELSAKTVLELENEFQRHPGKADVWFQYFDGDCKLYSLCCKRYKIDPNHEFIDQIKTLLGEGSVKIASW